MKSILSSDCQHVVGYLRDSIYDLTRQKYYLLSKFDTIKKIDPRMFSFLENEEIILNIPQDLVETFPDIDKQYYTNQEIASCQIHYIKEFDIKKIVQLDCRDFAFVIKSLKKQYKGLLNHITDLNNQPINSVQIHILNHNLNSFDVEKLESITKNYSFCSIYLHDCKFTENHRQLPELFNIMFVNKNQNSVAENFYINILSFLESQERNLFYNQFLFIDKEGLIRNSLEDSQSFGSIKDITIKTLKEMIGRSDFQKYWKANKEITDVCKDCEFRHMCVDNRLPHKRKENEWFHQQECNYNPYIAKWEGEEGYRTLADCGVISNEEGFSIDHERIAKINEELWGE